VQAVVRTPICPRGPLNRSGLIYESIDVINQSINQSNRFVLLPLTFGANGTASLRQALQAMQSRVSGRLSGLFSDLSRMHTREVRIQQCWSCTSLTHSLTSTQACCTAAKPAVHNNCRRREGSLRNTAVHSTQYTAGRGAHQKLLHVGAVCCICPCATKHGGTLLMTPSDMLLRSNSNGTFSNSCTRHAVRWQ